MGNHGKVRVSQNPEPLRGEILNSRVSVMIHHSEKNKHTIRIAKVEKNIAREDLSERILKEIQFMENEESSMISDEDFQLIICDSAAAWAVRRKEDGCFLAEITRRYFGEDKGIHYTWTKNLRDAMVLTEENKAQMIAYSLLDSRGYEPVPLIYQVDPLFKTDE